MLWLAVFLIVTANGRPIGGGDVVPASLLPVALIRGDGPFLDRFDHALRTPDGRLPGYVTESRGRIVSRYPIGAAIVAVPFYWPQVAIVDRLEPGWERDGNRARSLCRRMSKNAAAAIAAWAVVVMAAGLHRMGLARVAIPAALIVGMGSDHWSMASQALWQHGPAALCLASALLWLRDDRNGDGDSGPTSNPGRLALAGLASALMVVCRPVDVVFAGAISLWVLATRDRIGRWAFHVPAALVAGALLSYNIGYFDTPYGGYADLEETHSWAHGTEGTWTSPLLEGASGTLFSPSHGLFVYSPWIAMALVALPWSVRGGRLPRSAPERWLLWSLAPTFLILSKYSCWWGGHCFGPRFWIDAGPIVAVPMALALDLARRRSRPLLIALTMVAAWSIALQAVGFLCYPSTWHGTPVNADLHHDRLWDWRDNEVTRGLAEGIRPAEW